MTETPENIVRAGLDHVVGRPELSVLRVANGAIERAGSEIRLNIDHAALAAVFGVDDPNIASRLLGQLINLVQPDAGKPIDPAMINPLIATVQGIAPGNALEAKRDHAGSGAACRARCFATGHAPSSRPTNGEDSPAA